MPIIYKMLIDLTQQNKMRTLGPLLEGAGLRSRPGECPSIGGTPPPPLRGPPPPVGEARGVLSKADKHIINYKLYRSLEEKAICNL